MQEKIPSGFDAYRGVGSAVQDCQLVWIEIELADEEGRPVAGEKYTVQLMNGSLIEGTLDSQGKAYIDGIPRGNCKITFANLDKNEWWKS